MKKNYHSPAMTEIVIAPTEAIAEDPNSFPYNDGELGWT